MCGPSPRITELVVRPTGIVDPDVQVVDLGGYGGFEDHLLAQIEGRRSRGERALVTCITKRAPRPRPARRSALPRSRSRYPDAFGPDAVDGYLHMGRSIGRYSGYLIMGRWIGRPGGRWLRGIEFHVCATSLAALGRGARRSMRNGCNGCNGSPPAGSAEALAEFLSSHGVAALCLHSGVKPTTRLESLERLRRGEVEGLVGCNLLREGLDLPEV